MALSLNALQTQTDVALNVINGDDDGDQRLVRRGDAHSVPKDFPVELKIEPDVRDSGKKGQRQKIVAGTQHSANHAHGSSIAKAIARQRGQKQASAR
jgi:hypothetical protein